MLRQYLNVTVDPATNARLEKVDNKSAYVRQIIEIRDRDWRFAMVQVLRTVPAHLVWPAVRAVEPNLHRAWPSRHNIVGSIRMSDLFDHFEKNKLLKDMTDLSAWAIWTIASELDLGNKAVLAALSALEVGELLRAGATVEPSELIPPEDDDLQGDEGYEVDEHAD